ncbi:MAG: TIGR01459 family HAD-type hydrolase [Alphaproteobacteria bacterium]
MTKPATNPQPHIEHCDGLSQIVDKYDGLLLDVWGVLHNGEAPYPGVIDCLAKLKAAGKDTLLFSNAPRRPHQLQEQLTRLGITRDMYGQAITSGEVTHQWLKKHHHAGKKYYFLGVPAKDSSLYDDLEQAVFVDSMQDADLNVASNFLEDRSDLAAYTDEFSDAIAAKVPMACANPDIIVNKGDKTLNCSGMLAQHYAELGGDVTYFGKPYAAIYDYAQTLLPGKKLLAIGDSLATDIKGATSNGIDAALVATGIHAADFSDSGMKFEESLNKLSMIKGVWPKYFLPSLRW